MNNWWDFRQRTATRGTRKTEWPTDRLSSVISWFNRSARVTNWLQTTSSNVSSSKRDLWEEELCEFSNIHYDFSPRKNLPRKLKAFVDVRRRALVSGPREHVTVGERSKAMTTGMRLLTALLGWSSAAGKWVFNLMTKHMGLEDGMPSFAGAHAERIGHHSEIQVNNSQPIQPLWALLRDNRHTVQ